ncbi:MAG: hypothetical protein A2Y45_06075 [Tenericutes bacterium GWC2_34_14]|nr:MAG: hypothetical protein A2Z84_04150 [Tenericutes bacterium GWA2_35_7]OHE28522.1 MAG: hypothetical protein A2Y45_06075 [Tenericutes bacterium GWC2_34_14]OHE33570.1 MAG: hypothetical protein A2012_03735 [Tenericutes bacterium GWE2_34_108]OHE36855.1 MAG: hypothetical protein A2Y46_09535 [Tenericutes bacterium GWF1_35_14]OHE38065.1 MAG: hypothetical protein A2Y44_09130 [Tenericutes bacterium GWF2_35_184]OHE42088.1 MAG: hypothetical protein A3K26_07955 [Tenericutes bacterium RIFOXYA12_FULL_35_
MSFEELQKTDSYKKLGIDVVAFFAIDFFGLIFLFGGIYGDSFLIVFGIITMVFSSWGLYYFAKQMNDIKKYAKTFKKAEGKVVNFEQSGLFTHLVAVFVDDENEERRMLSTDTLRRYVVDAYLEKKLDIYYSPKFKTVLIYDPSTEEVLTQKEEEKEDDPYAL